MQLASRLRLRRPSRTTHAPPGPPVGPAPGEPRDAIVVRVAGLDLTSIEHAGSHRASSAARYRWTERTDLIPDITVAPDIERALTVASPTSAGERPIVVVWDRTSGRGGAAVRVLEGGADAFVASPDVEVLLAQLDALVRRPPRDATAHLRSLAAAV